MLYVMRWDVFYQLEEARTRWIEYVDTAQYWSYELLEKAFQHSIQALIGGECQQGGYAHVTISVKKWTENEENLLIDCFLRYPKSLMGCKGHILISSKIT